MLSDAQELIFTNFQIRYKTMKKEENDINKDLILREELALQRTRLANQSTFLSFLRTSMYFLIAALSVSNFYTLRYALVVEIFLFVVAALLLIIGILNYFAQARMIKQSQIHVGNYKTEYLRK